MSDISVGQKYTHTEDGYIVTVTQLKQKQLGTADKPIHRILVAYTDDAGNRMLTEQKVFLERYQLI